MIAVFAFLCSVNLAPVDCTRETAMDTMTLGNADNIIVCQMGAQMTLAGLAIRPGPGERWVIKCQLINIGNPVG